MVEHQLYLDEGYIFGTGGAGFERISLACPGSALLRLWSGWTPRQRNLDLRGELRR